MLGADCPKALQQTQQKVLSLLMKFAKT